MTHTANPHPSPDSPPLPYTLESFAHIDHALSALRARIGRRAMSIARVYGRDVVSVEDAVQAIGDVMKGVGS